MKILYVTTISDTVNAFLIPHIKLLIDEGYQVDVAFNIEQEVKSEIYELGCRVYQLPFQRSPLVKENITAYKLIKNIISTEGYDLVHTHTPVASAIVRIACRNLKNVRVFYTAHGFHFYKGAPILNWLAYYPFEKFLARYTDTLITINKEDYDIAKSNFRTTKVEYVPGIGIDTEKYSDVKLNRGIKREEVGVPAESFVILSVGELNKNKNHKLVINALAAINDSNIHYIICGEGYLERRHRNLAMKLGVSNNIHFLGFRKDVREIYSISDLFVFPSLREGLPVSLMEAMIEGLPIICSNIRGNKDLIKDNLNGYLIDSLSKDDYIVKILELKGNAKTSNLFSIENKHTIQRFSLKEVLKKTIIIYKGFDQR